MYTIICGNCNKAILTFNKKFRIGDVIDAENFIFMNGTHPVNNTSIQCPLCKYQPALNEFNDWITNAQSAKDD